MTKIAIPIVEDRGDQSLPSEHFGRAPLFYFYDTNETSVVPNDSDHFGGKGKPPQRLIDQNVKVLIAVNMGMKAIEMFQNTDVAVFKTPSQPVADILRDFNQGKLQELTEGCTHSKH